eukprot:jgi/Psemu1/43138/gm1.43138_g
MSKCKDTTPYAFYEWCTAFQAHCVCYSKYCHPYPCFKSTCTHHCSQTPDDDLPSTFITKIDNNSHIIWDVLHVAFSSIPDYLHILNQNNRYGYETLCSIIACMHPNHAKHPTSLITIRPTQGQWILTKYWTDSTSEHNIQTVHDANEREHFLNGCNHSKFLHAEFHRKQHVSHLKHKLNPRICSQLSWNISTCHIVLKNNVRELFRGV